MHTAITEDDRVDRDLICANSKAFHQRIQGWGGGLAHLPC